MSDTTNRLAGIATVTVDGVSYMLSGELEYQVSGVKRDTLVGQDRVHGYSEMPVQGYISGSFRDNGQLSTADINAMTNVTVVAELANGKTIVGRNGWTVETPPAVKTTEATFDVKWEFISVSEA
ncbi:MAG: phage tail tube protein [Dokdonella sp.]|uniref:phage tail tube protein n=1 Tax=Dokdonella sp. TaxID=2291710 RepID=UPI003F80C6B8